MVEYVLPKHRTGVRFPLPAPQKMIVFCGAGRVSKLLYSRGESKGVSMPALVFCKGGPETHQPPLGEIPPTRTNTL